MPEAHPLTREEKLLAEHSVQLGNIVEAIKSIGSSGGMDAINTIQTQLTELLGRLQAVEAVQQQNQTSLQNLGSLLSNIQTAYAEDTDTVAAPTPDTIREIIEQLNITIPADQQL